MWSTRHVVISKICYRSNPLNIYYKCVSKTINTSTCNDSSWRFLLNLLWWYAWSVGKEYPFRAAFATQSLLIFQFQQHLCKNGGLFHFVYLFLLFCFLLILVKPPDLFSSFYFLTFKCKHRKRGRTYFCEYSLSFTGLAWICDILLWYEKLEIAMC